MKITFQVNSCGTNELEKYKKRVVLRHIFVQGTLAIDRSAERQARELGARPGELNFFLSRPRPNVGRLRRPGAVRVQPWARK